MHELAHVDGGEEGEGHRDEERVERPLERAVDQRRQAELRFEVIGPAGRLPDPRGFRVPLVPDLAEEGAERDFWVWVVDLPLGDPPGRVHGQERV